MTRRQLDFTKLKDVYPTSPDAAGVIWTRWDILSSSDPYLAFFTDDTRHALANAVVTGISSNVRDCLIVTAPDTMHATVMDVLDRTPLAALLTTRFKNHIADMFVRVAFPETYQS